MKVILNLLAATTGGQLSRARAFLDRFEKYAPDTQLIVLKEKTVLTEYVTTHKTVFLDVAIGFGRIKALRRMWWENFIMPSVVRQQQADVYLTFSHYLPQLRNLRVPSVVGVSNLAPFSKEAWDQESFSVRFKMMALRQTILSSVRRASCVLALSEMCRNILNDCGIPNERIVVAPNGVDINWSKASEPSDLLSRIGVRNPYLLYASHFHRYKNHGRLIKAFSRLSVLTREAHQLVLVGKPDDPSWYQETKQLIDNLGLSGQVIMIPGMTSDNLRTLYQKAKLFVFPSLIENSPNILLEAMMAGVPILSSDLSPMPEFCGDAAEYFDALSVADMSECLERLLTDSDRLSNLKDHSRGQANKFTWDKFVSSVVACVEVVGSNKN